MDEKLLELAKEVCVNSYSPYSKFPVGAAVLFEDGSVYTGVNAENASFGLTLCAERNAISTAIASGQKGAIVAISVYSPKSKMCAPCGACRQVLNELIGKDTPIYLSNGKEEVTKTMRELLPMSFDEEDVL